MTPGSSGTALAVDSVAYAGVGFGGLGLGGFGAGGLGFGGFGYPSMGAGVIGAPGMYGSFGGPSSGIGMSLPPMPEFGAGAYRAGNQLPDSTVGMGMGVGNPIRRSSRRKRRADLNRGAVRRCIRQCGKRRPVTDAAGPIEASDGGPAADRTEAHGSAVQEGRSQGHRRGAEAA